MRISRFWRLYRRSRSIFFPNGAKFDIGYHIPKPNPQSIQEKATYPDFRGFFNLDFCEKIYDEELIDLTPQIIKDEASTFPEFKKGCVLDAASLPIDFTPRKYLMVCCFMVPLISCEIQDLISICSEIRSLHSHDFEVLLVPKMRRRWSSHHPSFKHFLSGFPSFCRAIPFSQHKTRHLISYHLGLQAIFYGIPMFSLLQRSSTSNVYKVLRTDDIGFFYYNGADLFPFDDNLLNKRVQLRTSKYSTTFPPTTLEQFLGLNSSQLQVFKYNLPCGSVAASASLSQLKNKVVGLYLCGHGFLLSKLDKLCRQCKDRGLDFEVIMVYMPVTLSFDYSSFIQVMNQELYNLQGNTSSWWILPFTDSVSRRLLAKFPDSYHDLRLGLHPTDMLAFFGPNGECVNPHAGPILYTFGSDVYPLTRIRLIEWELEKVRSLTLESLLVYGDRDFVVGKDNNGSEIRVPVTQLRGRIILFLFDIYTNPEDYEPQVSENSAQFKYVDPDAALLCKYYFQLKSAHPSFEVVSITSPYYEVASPDLPWLMCPCEPEHIAFVKKILGGVPSHSNALIAFGEDGRVSSYRALDLLQCNGLEAFPFNGDLRQEVIRELRARYSEWTIFDSNL